MRSTTTLLVTFILVAAANVANAQSVTYQTRDGNSDEIAFTNSTIGNKGIFTASDQLIRYDEIDIISTADFNAYEQAMKKAGKKTNRHIKVVFTGDQNVYALQLEKLQKKRTGAHVARAAGGIMTLIGVLAGDRQLTAAGIATHGAGDIALDINTEKTIASQNQMISELHENQNNGQEETIEAQYRREYGNENVDAIIALLEEEDERAIALANAAETSKDANYRLSAIYVKALIAVDLGQTDEADKEYDRMVLFDPDIKTTTEAKAEIKFLHDELEKMRRL